MPAPVYTKEEVNSALDKLHAFWDTLTENEKQVLYAMVSVSRSPDFHSDESPVNMDWLNVRRAITFRMRAICFGPWCTDPKAAEYLHGIEDKQWRDDVTKALKKMPAHYQSHYSVAYWILTKGGYWVPELEPTPPLTWEQCYWDGTTPLPGFAVASPPTGSEGQPS